MTNKTTLVMSVLTVVIFAAIGVGFLTSRPVSQPTTQPVAQEAPLPTTVELEATLLQEQPLIDAAIAKALPTLQEFYTTERQKLYHRGEWYGAILQYTGGDVNSRDTLRIVLQKKKGAWIVRTTPPSLLVNAIDLPDAPIAMLDDINKPAVLAGTDTSPTITPGE